MGCSCPMLRGTCNAATVLDGRARRFGRVFRWVPKTPPGLPPFPSGGVRIWRTPGAAEDFGTFAFTRALLSVSPLKNQGR